MFVLLSAWRKTKLQDTPANRLAMTYGSTAVSITVTSLTNMAAFFIGTLTSLEGVRIFCIYLGVSVLFTYVWFLTFFGACLAMFGGLEKQQRHSLFCWKVESKSEAESKPFFYKLFCTGGISQTDPWNANDNKPCRMSSFFKNHFALALNNKVVKAGIILLYFIYLLGSIYGCLHLEQGLDLKNLAVDGSYLSRFFDMENQNFRKFPYRIQVVIKGNVTYSNRESRKHLIQLHRALENVSHIGPRLYTRSWIRGFFGFLGKRPQIRQNITDEASFIAALKTHYIEPMMKENVDIVYNEDETKILASRFIIQGYEVKDLNEDMEMIRSLREIADDSPLDVSIYHPAFFLYDQNLVVTKSTTKIVAIAAFIMMIVSFIFIPNPLSSMWVGISILSIQVGVIGYMSLWGVRLDFVSMINLIMSIGFSVDFSAHIVYAYVSSKYQTSKERLKESMYTMGLPIIQSGVTTILGVALFVLVPSYVYRTFFKIIFLVTIFGMMHALLVLPVLLSLTSHGFCKSQNNNNEETSKDKKEHRLKHCFNTGSNLREEELNNKYQKRDLCNEDSNFSRNSCSSGSNSVQTESLRSSNGSSGQSSKSETKGTQNTGFDSNHDSIEVERL